MELGKLITKLLHRWNGKAEEMQPADDEAADASEQEMLREKMEMLNTPTQRRLY